MMMITLTAGTCVLLAKLKQNQEIPWSGKVEYSVTGLVGSMSLLVRETCPWSGAGTCVCVRSLKHETAPVHTDARFFQCFVGFS